MATQMVGIRLDTKLVERIDDVAKKQGTSRTAVIERAIGLGLREEEELLQTLEGTSVSNRVQRLVLNGLIKSNLLEVMASVLNEEIDPERKAMVAEKLRKPKGKSRHGAIKAALG